MKFLKYLPILLTMTSCAAGSVISSASAISGYSFKSKESESLTRSYETSLVYRIKKELAEENK